MYRHPADRQPRAVLHEVPAASTAQDQVPDPVCGHHWQAQAAYRIHSPDAYPRCGLEEHTSPHSCCWPAVHLLKTQIKMSIVHLAQHLLDLSQCVSEGC